MISVEIRAADDTFIAGVWMRSAPRVGEILWFAGQSREKVKGAQGVSSFTVTDVAHWISDSWSPTTHTGEPIHSVCAYVRPTEAE